MDEQNRFAEQMPQTIGRYKVQESIGFGAMGAVYKAFDPLIKRTLAIKTIRLDIPRQSPQYKSFIERFYHEARISGTLSHPNIVTLFDIGEEGGVPYLAMEFVEGETILSLIEKGVRFHPEKVISLVSQIASALDYAHSKGVIHRDIKPSNVILFDGDRVKVTDFGIAKLVDAEMTQGGTLLGTPSYMSPEQAMGEKLDGRSDIFSLGVCAFEMLSGEQPFPGNNVTSILYKLVHVDPVEPASLEMNGLVPQKWHEVFSKVLAKKPDERYQTASEFVQDLEYCLGSWFGAAVGDETLSEPPAALVDATLSVSRPPSPPSPEPQPVHSGDDGLQPTVAMPVLGAKPAAPVSSPVKAPAPPPARAEDASEETVMMKAGAPPKAAPPAPPKAPEPEGIEATEATVVMKAGKPTPPPLPPAPADEPPAAKTILMDASQLPVVAPPRTRTPAPPPVEATVAMPTVGAVEKTQMMEVTVKAPRAVVPPVSSETVKAPVPSDADTIRKAPRPPVPAPPLPKAPAPPPPTLTSPSPIPEEAAPRPGLPTGLILGGAALVFLLAAVVVGILVWKRLQPTSGPSPSPSPVVTPSPGPSPSPAVTPSPSPAALLGTFHVETTPAGVAVSVDGQARGVTPLDLADLALGTHEVKLELKGFEVKTQNLELTEAAPAGELKIAMTKLSPVMGVADILSTPFGAAVAVDGAQVGQTPLTEFRLKVGSHRVEIAKDGFEGYSEVVRVEVGKRARVDAQLRALPKPTPQATPNPDAVDTTKVYNNVSSEVDTLARKISGKAISYPESAPRLKSGDQVSITVSFVVNESGDVLDPKIVESAGKVLDETVLQAVRTWKYTPAAKKGTKVKAGIVFKQTFRAG
jgi:TonB family protein